MLFDSILAIGKLFSKLEVNPLKPCWCFINQVYITDSILDCHFSSLHSVFSRIRFHLKKSLFLFICKKQLLICSVMKLQQSSPVFRLHFLFSWYFHHICSYFLYWNLEPLKVIHDSWNQFFLTAVNVDILICYLNQ